MRRVTSIKNLSDQRRIPRLGKIRLGIKAVTPSGKSYPREVPHFVCPPEVAAIYGDTPTILDVRLPTNDRAVIFPQAYEFYGSGRGLICTGDGESAYRKADDGSIAQCVCPCELLEQDKCKQRAHLMVILDKVSVGGVYQIDTSSFNSIVDVNSSLDYVEALVGRIAMVPLQLVREARETHHDGKKQTHYTLSLRFNGTLADVNNLLDNTVRVLERVSTLRIEPPTQENPALDDGATVVDAEDAEIVNATPAAETPQTVVQGIEVAETLSAAIAAAITIEAVNEQLDLLRTHAAQGTIDEKTRASIQRNAAKRVQSLINASKGK